MYNLNTMIKYIYIYIYNYYYYSLFISKYVFIKQGYFMYITVNTRSLKCHKGYVHKDDNSKNSGMTLRLIKSLCTQKVYNLNDYISISNM